MDGFFDIAIIFCIVVAVSIFWAILITKTKSPERRRRWAEEDSLERADRADIADKFPWRQRHRVEQKDRKNTEKGKFGEQFIAEILKDFTGNYYIINDIIVTKNGRHTQIDHIVIRENGVFVIETKNIYGNIYGYPDDQSWRQELTAGRSKLFYNPIKQNAYHIKLLCEIFDSMPKNIFVPVVVFTDKAYLQVKHKSVIESSRLLQFISQDTGIKLSMEQINRIHWLLLYFKEHPQITHEEHIENIKEYVKNVCPMCGGKLFLREGYSKFYGCSNYPECKFTKEYWN